MKHLHKILLACLLLVLVVIIGFEPIRHNDFVQSDDATYITGNPHVTSGINRQSIIWAFTTFHMGHWHPLTWLSHMLDCQLFGLSPLGHHLHNLLLHLINTLLLFFVLQRFTGAFWRSAFVAAAFALHPLRVESVAWAADRKDLLSTVFWLLTLWAYWHYVRHPRFGIYLVMFLFFALGLMAKAMLVTLPFILLLLDYWPLGRLRGKGSGQARQKSLPRSGSAVSPFMPVSLTRLLVEKIPLLILVPFSVVIGSLAQEKSQAMIDIRLFPLMDRITNAIVYYVRYLGKICYPRHLASLYLVNPNPYPFWLVGLCLLLLLGITILAFYLRRRRPYLLVGWLWFLVILLPVIGLLQSGLQAIADRYTYLPSIGIFIMFAWGLEELLRKWRYQKVALALSACLVLGAFTIAARLQLSYWRNNYTLCEHALEVTRDNYLMHNDFGNSLAARGRFEEAVFHFQEALRIYPDFPEAYYNLANTLFALNKPDAAVTYYRKLLQFQPEETRLDFAQVYNNLGVALAVAGRPDEAIIQFHRALLINPGHREAKNNLTRALQSKSQTK